MPRRKLFYLSFQGNKEQQNHLSSSYWFNGTNPVPKQIPFATERPRKLLPKHANFCLINYPFDLNDSYKAFENMEYKKYYNSQHLLYFRNKAIQEIQLFFKKVECGSVIYIDFHGREGISYFIQFILIEHNNEKQELRIPIPAHKFARIIADAIPLQARKSIEFRFIVCCAEAAPQIVMEILHHEFGFKKSCCIYYRDIVTRSISNYTILDFCCEDLFPHEGKRCIHNYLGRLYDQDYYYFKEHFLMPNLTYLFPSPRLLLSTDNKIKQLMNLRALLIQAVLDHKKDYESNANIVSKFFKGNSPLIMESYLLSRLQGYDADIVKILDYENNELQPIHELIFQLEKMLIVDIVHFTIHANDEKPARMLDISNNACFSYLLKSLDTFYLMFNSNRQRFESAFLDDYFHHIIITPHNLGKNGFILGACNSEAGRAQLKSRIVNSPKYFRLQY